MTFSHFKPVYQLTIAYIKKNCLKYSIPVILFLYAAVFLLHLHLFGIGTTLEAEKYIQEAKNLVNHKALSALRFWFYSITIFLIYVSLQLKIGFTGAVILQSLLNLAVILFFHASLKLLFRPFSILPVLIVCTAVIFSPYSSWNVFLFTESVFYSSILLLVSTIIQHSITKKKSGIQFIFLALLLTILARPLGILFIPGVLCYLYLIVPKKNKRLIIPAAIIGLGALLFVTNIIFTTTSNVPITLSATEGCIVCGIIPSTHPALDLSTTGTPVQQLYYYVSHNFSHFISLAILRLKAFFFMTRPYYSNLHNIFLLLFIVPLYILSLAGLAGQKEKTYKPVFYFMLISISTFATVIMMQCDDYHNRFVLGLFPFFLIMAAKATETKKLNRFSFHSN